MDDEESDLEHAQVSFPCPACLELSTACACELEKHPQVRCPHCDCLHTVEYKERKDVWRTFYDKMRKSTNGDV